MVYDFLNLSPADFEDLCRDLIGRDLRLTFEAFASGPDQGMDGRHSRGGSTTILQAKHYTGSSFSSLKSTMKRERASIDALAPGRYILATSQKLTPSKKAQLEAEIGPALQDQADILGAEDLNALLRKFPDIAKAHIKLWLSSTAVLERVLHSAAHEVTAITRGEIEAKVRVYAQNPSFNDAQIILEGQHVLIVSGPPGVGKTTLAEMLSYAYLADEWQLVVIRSLDDGFSTIIDNKKQIFLFDDFLGKISLDARALAAKDSDLTRFIRRVRKSPNARFILTTRAYIFEEARRASEHLGDERLNISRYLLDVSIYTRRIRARILYNHLVVAGTPLPLVRALIESGAIPKVVDHKNYSPRVIEWMTDADRIQDLAPADYPEAFLKALSHPKQLWDTAYRKHIPELCKHLLLTMFFCVEYGVELEDLRIAYEPLHERFSSKYGHPRDPKDFEEATRILEGGFITIRGTQVVYVNPSFRDYMRDYVHDIGLLCTCAEVAQTVRWAEAVWKIATPTAFVPAERRKLALSFLTIAAKFAAFPTSVQTNSGHRQASDSGCVDRVELLLQWWEATGDERFSQFAMNVAEELPQQRYWPIYMGWREGAELVDLVSRLRSGDYFYRLELSAPIAIKLEVGILRLLDGNLAIDELENVIEAIETADPPASEDVRKAAIEAIRREASEIETNIENIFSETTLNDYANSLANLAPRASISPEVLSEALMKVKERISDLNEEKSVAHAPSIPPSSKPADIFDDSALRNLFMPLLHQE